MNEESGVRMEFVGSFEEVFKRVGLHKKGN